ncbi:putative integral membrane protein [Thozetella sp. PMI_491]|nr:putative integral membrane protein [Thozetella sp. PMI_491]
MSSDPSTQASPDTASPPMLTPEQIAALPHDNAAPKLNIIIWVLAALSGIFLVLRLYCKISRRNRLWWDDYILVAAWVCLIIECSLLSAMTGLGYGLHVWDIDIFNLEKMGQVFLLICVTGTFSITAAIWSKTSFAFTMLRLTHGWQRALVWFIIVTGNIAMGVSAILPWVQCSPINRQWDLTVEGTCLDPHPWVYYNIFSAAYSAVMDLTLSILPWAIVWKLQMKRTEKIGIALAMSMGIFAGITALVKTSKVKLMLSLDFADNVDLFIWGNAESSVTIIAASIPILRVFIRDVKTSRRSASDDRGLRSESSKASWQRNKVIVLGGDANIPDARGGEENSDNSIDLEPLTPGRIVRTNSVSIEYHEKINSGHAGFGTQTV